jgi:hypothetical protein
MVGQLFGRFFVVFGRFFHKNIWSPCWQVSDAAAKQKTRDLKFKGLNPGTTVKCSGLYYKHVMIVIDAPSVVKVMLQIVASLTIVIDDAS